MTEKIKELFEAYNYYTNTEFDSDPISPEDVGDYTLGVAFTTVYMDEKYKDEQEIQIDYDYKNEAYKCYISNELVYTEPAPIKQAVWDFKSASFDSMLSYFVDHIRDIEGYENISF